jgi:hypothetical protein
VSISHLLSEVMEHEQEKQQAADRAVAYVQSSMVVGLGAGSTALLATQRIGQLLRKGQLRNIIGFPCSRAIEAEARSLAPSARSESRRSWPRNSTGGLGSSSTACSSSWRQR